MERSQVDRAPVILTTTPLAGSATAYYPSASGEVRTASTMQVAYVRAIAWSDVAGTLTLEESDNDGVSWATTVTLSVAASTFGFTPHIALTKKAWRWKYVNGATIQAKFSLLEDRLPVSALTLVTGSTMSALTTLQSAAVATGNGTALDTFGQSTVIYTVTIATTATITFEGTPDSGTTWVAFKCVNLATGVIGTTATATGVFRGDCAGFTSVRARISAWTSGAVTVTAVTTSAFQAPRTLDVVVRDAAGNALTLENVATRGDAFSPSVIGSYVLPLNYVYNGTTWDKVRGVNTGQVVVTLKDTSGNAVPTVNSGQLVVTPKDPAGNAVSGATGGSVPAGAMYMGGLSATSTLKAPTVDTWGGNDGVGVSALQLLMTGAENYLFNNVSLDRQRNNYAVTLLASAARTATVSSSDQVNYNSRGLRIPINVTAASGSPSVVFTVEVKDSISGVYTAILTSAAITGTGHTELRVGLGITTAANLAVSDLLSRTFRVTATHGNTDSITYSVACEFLM